VTFLSPVVVSTRNCRGASGCIGAHFGACNRTAIHIDDKNGGSQFISYKNVLLPQPPV